VGVSSVNGSAGRRPCDRLSLLLALLPLCGCDCGKSPCDGVDCSGFGTCTALPDDLGAYCLCDPGYHPVAGGLDCAPNDATDPCLGVDCGGHGFCGRTPEGFPLCVCFPGWHIDETGMWCLPDDSASDGGPDESGGSDADADADGGLPDGTGADADADGAVRWEDLWAYEPTATKLDMLVLVDDSGSMHEEQSALTVRFPELLDDLMNPPLDPETGMPVHPPLEDLNLGVISTDMGTMGHRVAACLDHPAIGDDGCLLNTPSTAVSGCGRSYPLFLSRNPGNADGYGVEQMSLDFTCLATIGTQGCGFEQPFKALEKAISDNTEPGRCNEGFLRPDSMVALIVVSDEEDCSVEPTHPEMFDQDRGDLGHLNLRCFLHPEFVIPVEHYLRSFQRLLPGRLGPVFFSAIVGVPMDAPQCIGRGDALDECLDLPAMQEQIDPDLPTQLVPSCDTRMGQAYPPRRFVQLAIDWMKGGGLSRVDSICKSDFLEAIQGISDNLVDSIADDIVCTRDLPFDEATCMTSCYMFELLNDGRRCAADPSCPQAWCPAATLETLDRLEPCRNPDTRELCTPLERDLGTDGPAGFERRRCLLRQAKRNPFAERCGGEPREAGWYYDPSGWGECRGLRFYHPGTELLIDPLRSIATLRCWL
jgi:hypothetical protein